MGIQKMISRDTSSIQQFTVCHHWYS